MVDYSNPYPYDPGYMEGEISDPVIVAPGDCCDEIKDVINTIINRLNEDEVVIFSNTDRINDLELRVTNIESGKVEMTAGNTTYNHPDYPTVKDALDKILYVEPVITEFRNNIGTVEIGSIIDTVELTWSINKDVISQSLTNVESLDPSVRNYSFTGLNLTNNKQWTLTIDDGQNTANKTTGVYFKNGRYWGVSSSTVYDNSLIQSFAGKELIESINTTFTVTAGPGEHIYYAYPARLGEATFYVGGFEGGFDLVATIDFTNSNGYTEPYRIYKSQNANLGTTTVEVR